MVILTAGSWLLAIPFYPKRCTTCGCTEGGAARASLALAAGPPSREKQLAYRMIAAFVFGVFVLVVLFIWLGNLESPDKSASTPATQTPTETVSSPVGTSAAEDHELHILPNYFGNPLSDGRTYSVYTIAVYQNKIPLHTQLFVQGRIVQFILGMIVLEDEKERSMRMACFAKNQDEYYEIQRFYPIGTTVQVSGEYAGDSARIALSDQKVFEGHPVLSNCIAASATEEEEVVRPAQLSEMSRLAPTTDEMSGSSPEKETTMPAVDDKSVSPPIAPATSIATPAPPTVPTQSTAHPSQLRFETGVRLMIRVSSLNREPDGSFTFRGTLLLPVALTSAVSLDQTTKLTGSGAANGRKLSVTEFTVNGENYGLRTANGSNKQPGSGPAVELNPGKVLEMFFGSASVYEKTTGVGAQ